MNIYLKVTERQKDLLNCVFYNEIMKLEDRIHYDCTEPDQKELILNEINDLLDLLLQLKEH
jgi:DNA-binding MarR family transcriptional regulator